MSQEPRGTNSYIALKNHELVKTIAKALSRGAMVPEMDGHVFHFALIKLGLQISTFMEDLQRPDVQEKRTRFLSETMCYLP